MYLRLEGHPGDLYSQGVQISLESLIHSAGEKSSDVLGFMSHLWSKSSRHINSKNYVLLTNSLPFVNVGALAALSSPQSKVIEFIFLAVVVRQFIIRHFQNNYRFESLYCIESYW